MERQREGGYCPNPREQGCEWNPGSSDEGGQQSSDARYALKVEPTIGEVTEREVSIMTPKLCLE